MDIIFISLLVATSYSAADKAVVVMEKTTPIVSLSDKLQSTSILGIKKAGLICMPSGALTAEEVFLSLGVETVLSDFKKSTSAKLLNFQKIKVTHAAFNLCAKRYIPFGLGSKKGYSGKVSLSFELHYENQIKKCDGVKIKIKPARPIPEIWKSAFRKVFLQCLGSEAKE